MPPCYLDLARAVRDTILPRLVDRKKTLNLFLIGAQATKILNPKKLRPKLRKALESMPQVRVLYPEGLFDDLIYGEQLDLLGLENILARSVHAVVICPESPGSFTELGAFSNHHFLRKRLIVIGDQQYEKERSFIRLGPLRYLSQQKHGRVMWFDYSSPDVAGLAETVVKVGRRIGKEHPPDSTLLNLIQLERFGLAGISVLQPISSEDLADLVSRLVALENADQDEVRLSKAATSAVIGQLFRSKFIRLESNRYVITHEGKDHLFGMINASSRAIVTRDLDALRVQAINAYRRKKFSLEERQRVLRLTQLSPLF